LWREFPNRWEVTKEREAMRLVKRRLDKLGSEFEQATLDLYIWELQNKLCQMVSEEEAESVL